ncbi:tetratricopeptide repeat protein [Litchfieldia alkalitelluris]|uniref:tetratricopeptide repeat protein n=1 Tax=Litchfieldia alkalitelluris TaxID=304268 RepID=UPI00099692B8|nr:hypothetical protein [Litchfieldia alkalitelluris]
MSNHVRIVEKNVEVLLEVNRVAFYAQGKVVECRGFEDNQVFYLYFYKNEFLTGKRATKVKPGCFFETAMKHGITFDAPHPMIDQLFPSNQTLPIISLKQLLDKLEQQKTPQEIALILSFFNDFIKPESLQKVIEKQFFEYRRNGQLLNAYQILQIAKLMNQCVWARETANRIEYQKYDKQYSQSYETLLKIDPLFAELKSYPNRHKETVLSTIFKSKSRSLDLLALRFEDFTTSPTVETYQTLTTLIRSYLSQIDYVNTLLFLQKNTPFPQLQQDLIDLLLERKDYQQVFALISNYSIGLSFIQKEKLKDYLLSDDVLVSEYTCLHLVTLFKSERQTLEQILRQCVMTLLKKHHIGYVNQWLHPLKIGQLSLPILSTIEKMAIMQDDPDKQFLLGEYYHELQQYEKAIECFSWEMELNSTDPLPVKWLSKLYKELGMTNESKDYQQVFLSMQKHA